MIHYEYVLKPVYLNREQELYSTFLEVYSVSSILGLFHLKLYHPQVGKNVTLSPQNFFETLPFHKIISF